SGKIEQLFKRAAVEGRVEEEGWRMRKDGSRFWAEIVLTALHDSAGRLLGYAKVTRDITGREKAAESLRQRDEYTKTIIETANDAFIGMDDRGAIIEWNRQAEATFGWSRAEAVGRPVAELVIPPEHRSAHREGLERVLAGGEGPILNKRIEINA